MKEAKQNYIRHMNRMINNNNKKNNVYRERGGCEKEIKW